MPTNRYMASNIDIKSQPHDVSIQINRQNALSTEPSDSTEPSNSTEPSQSSSNQSICKQISCTMRIIIIGILLIGVILINIEMYRYPPDRHISAWYIAGSAVFLAVPIALDDALMHLIYLNSKKMQLYYIAIIMIVPIFATTSWFALRFHSYRIYFVLIREIYEAFVLFCFYKCMITFFGVCKSKQLSGSSVLVNRISSGIIPLTNTLQTSKQISKNSPIMISHKSIPEIKPMFPLCCFPKWKLDESFVKKCTIGIGQYCVLRFILAIVNASIVATNPIIFDEGSIKNIRACYLYFVIIINISQMWALYCLVMFLHVVKPHMVELYPYTKFLSIKLIVFLTFWQSILLEGLAYIDIIHASIEWTQEDVTNGLEDFIICIECVLFAILHHYCFSYTDFNTGSKANLAMQAILHPVTDPIKPENIICDISSSIV